MALAVCSSAPLSGAAPFLWTCQQARELAIACEPGIEGPPLCLPMKLLMVIFPMDGTSKIKEKKGGSEESTSSFMNL
jgi:hypothetical protein